MQALVYLGTDQIGIKEKAKPTITAPTDCIVKITTTTICGTDLHIWQGHVPSVEPGRTLGHEGVGIIEAVGSGVTNFQIGDKVLISCITSCGKCANCRNRMYSHCENGGWLLGNRIDGTQAEYVRIPFADTSLYPLPAGIKEEHAVLFSDILPTSFETGVLNGNIKPGDTVAIIGAGPIGLAALITAQLYSPLEIIAVDLDNNRLKVAKQLGATKTINDSTHTAVKEIMQLTNQKGVDVAIEAVGAAEAFETCQSIIAPGGHIANVGVHGKSACLHLESLWDKNITLTTALVNTSSIPMLLKTFASGKISLNELITHRFGLKDALKAYDVFRHSSKENSLKVILKPTI